MILTVSDVTTSLSATEGEAVSLARKSAGLPFDSVGRISKRAVDARRGQVRLVWSVAFDLPEGMPHRAGNSIRERIPQQVSYPIGDRPLMHRPVVVGFGPAGMICALTLAERGYRPLVLERGGSLEDRDRSVARFNGGGPLDPDCNVQFGEGGAGTYSDGKLNTGVNNPLVEEVLRIFARHGAGEEILTDAKPHVGTDRLKGVVASIRNRILEMGGEIRYRTKVTGFDVHDGVLRAVRCDGDEIPADLCVLCTGHSARDLFENLFISGIPMECKPFSMGFRIEHLQSNIDRALYGKYAGHPALGPADYKVWDRSGKRAVYSFCMCPGGTVVAAASAPGQVVTNGMSDSARSGRNANAALAVEVLPSDFDDAHPLSGIRLQQKFEGEAYRLGGENDRAPAMLLGDFLSDRPSSDCGTVSPTFPRGVTWTNISGLLLPGGAEDIRNAMAGFERRIHGFSDPDAVLTAPETRTSSPVRILRGEDLYSPACRGLIPCGEGAGYAGGITSAGADGLRAALRILGEFAPMEAVSHDE